jgi:dienelactone hydrolase
MKFEKIECRSTSLSGIPYIKYIFDKRTRCKNVLISHGSAGITSADLKLVEVCLQNGMNVISIDHFTHRGVVSQWWHKIETSPSIYDRMNDVLELFKDEPIDYVVGLSAGATTAMMVSGRTGVPAFAIYPSCYPIYESMTRCSKDSVMVSGKYDDWTTIDHAKAVSKLSGIELLEVGGYHGFMREGEDRYLDNVLSFKGSLDCHVYPDSYIPSEPTQRGVNVKYCEECVEITLKRFTEFLK